MEISELNQPQIFLCAVAVGLIIGVFYDVFRLLRTAGLNSLMHTFIQDIIFMCGCSVIAFFFAIGFNKGEVRVFTLLGHLCGLLAYRYTIGILTGRLFETVARILRRIKALAGRICKKIYNICKLTEGKISKKTVIFFRNTKKKKKNTLQVNSKMVYNKKKYKFLPHIIIKGKGKRND